MDRFIGMDVHAASTTFAVIDARGKRLHSKVVETNGSALIEFLQREPGTLHLCLEEGTQSTWLVEILSAHAKRIVVAHVSESRGHKSDERDAFALAEMLRTDAIKTVVYKHTGAFASLRLLVKAHTAAVRDTVRAQNRLKALFRSHGVEMSGANPYGAKHREERIAALPETARPSARVMFAHYDALQIAREHAESTMVEESHRHPISRVLETCPGLGPIRVAQLVSVVITPERFRTRAQLWAYCGLGVVMRSSSDWVRESGGVAEASRAAHTRAELQPQPSAQGGVQGRGDDGHRAAQGAPAARGVPASDRQRDEAAAREGDAGASHRGDGAVDVEEGGVSSMRRR